MQVGFQTLRDFVTQRPTLRGEAMTILLELTTHPGTGIARLMFITMQLIRATSFSRKGDAKRGNLNCQALYGRIPNCGWHDT